MSDYRAVIRKIVRDVENSIQFLSEYADELSSHGDFDKAISIREELLGIELVQKDRERTMLSLAGDFHKAGMYENAMNVLEEILITSHEKDRILEMMAHLCSEVNDWEKVVYYERKKQKIDESYLAYAVCQWASNLIRSDNTKDGLRKLKEAEMITPGNPHIALHYADFLLREGRDDELLAMIRETSTERPVFFGIFIRKILASGKFGDVLHRLVAEHLHHNPRDQYTVYITAKNMAAAGRHREAFDFIRKHYGKDAYNPYILKLLIESSAALGKSLDSAYMLQVRRLCEDSERWFKCRNCGHESEDFSFVCIRCGCLDTFHSLW